MDFQGRRSRIKSEQFLVGDFKATHNSNLYYLTGFTGFPALLQRQGSKDTLWIQKQTQREILFDGKAYDLEEVHKTSKVDEVKEADLESLIAGLSLNDQSVLHQIAKLRLVKTQEEISHMRTAAKISRKAHQEIAELIQVGASEWEIKTEFERKLFLSGARCTAYSTICGAGRNSTLLHATRYDRVLAQGEAFVLDGACKLDHYASDITSTWINRATDQQSLILDIVKKAQAEAIKAVRVGVTLAELHELATNSMSEDLFRLGLIQKQEEIKGLFPHRTSHWIGLDVHDPKVSDDDSQIKLQEGMTFTIEPGLYFSEELKTNYGDLTHTGVRFEEDILVTKNGAEVLSK